MPRAYYNEWERYPAEWLRNLIKEGLIADGDVDERSIKDVEAADLRGYTQCHFFAGIGGWSYALRLSGWDDARPVWTGSCPCQPFSVAGQQQGGADERHLWPEYFRLIRECHPATIFAEQVAAAIGSGWLDAVFTDLESEGYACAASVLPACSVGAPHIRQRLWFMADAESERQRADEPGRDSERGQLVAGAGARGDSCDDGAVDELPDAAHAKHTKNTIEDRPREGAQVELGGSCVSSGVMGNANSARSQGWKQRRDGTDKLPVGPSSVAGGWAELEWLPCSDGKARPTQPGLFPLADGLPEGMDYSRTGALKGTGNAIVPQAAAAFIGAYMDV